MMRSITKILLILGVCVGAVVWLTWSMSRLAQVECELCVDFNGQTACQTASGPTREDAIEEAGRAACARISAGVTQVLACQRAPRRDILCQPPE